ncbi:MAG: hypothetical protein QOG88_1737 [Actinomycetota bacterium]|jgi:hypothetical protein|nr:hypothetical protein [Actinomycetota bacterium]
MAWPAGPAAWNQTESTDSSANTTKAIPMASRAHGERTTRTCGRGGVFATVVLAGVRFAGLFFAGARDGVRRDGEVFCATYTSMITGRMTGLRWVTS